MNESELRGKAERTLRVVSLGMGIAIFALRVRPVAPGRGPPVRNAKGTENYRDEAAAKGLITLSSFEYFFLT